MLLPENFITNSVDFQQCLMIHQPSYQRFVILSFLYFCLHLCFQEAKKAHRAAISVKRPIGHHAPPVHRTNQKVRSDEAWMTKDDKLTIVRLQRYLDYAPKIVLPVTLRLMKKNLMDLGKQKMEDQAKMLLDPSHPARCTLAQYLDRYGNPILFYFGRCLVHKDEKKVHCSDLSSTLVKR